MYYVDAVGMNNGVRPARACGEPNIIEILASFSFLFIRTLALVSIV